jgi:APA family basic amino acid/polyamine antiporter
MWVTFASGYQVVYQALVVILAGLILYAFLNARRQRLGEAAEPKDFTAEVPAGELVGSE